MVVIATLCGKSPVSVSGILSKCLQGQMNVLFLNASQVLAGVDVRHLHRAVLDLHMHLRPFQMCLPDTS